MDIVTLSAKFYMCGWCVCARARTLSHFSHVQLFATLCTQALPVNGGSWKPLGAPGPARRLLLWCWRYKLSGSHPHSARRLPQLQASSWSTQRVITQIVLGEGTLWGHGCFTGNQQGLPHSSGFTKAYSRSGTLAQEPTTHG